MTITLSTGTTHTMPVHPGMAWRERFRDAMERVAGQPVRSLICDYRLGTWQIKAQMADGTWQMATATTR